MKMSYRSTWACPGCRTVLRIMSCQIWTVEEKKAMKKEEQEFEEGVCKCDCCGWQGKWKEARAA